MIDAHNHLDFDAFDADRSRVVAEARARDVSSFVLAGTHPDTWSRTAFVAENHGGIAVLGVHPGWADRIADWDAVLAELRCVHAAGIGEIGLDRRAATTDEALDWQVRGLRAQLSLARELDRVVVFHCVGAYPELLATIRRDGLPGAGGMIHGWSGPPDRVAEALDLGLSISFGPAIARSHAPRQAASARAVPLDRLLVETDAPDQPLESGRRGVPADLGVVADAVAQARDVPSATVREATHDNAIRLFAIGSSP